MGSAIALGLLHGRRAWLRARLRSLLPTGRRTPAAAPAASACAPDASAPTAPAPAAPAQSRTVPAPARADRRGDAAMTSAER
ncbi:hypothetical protein ACQ4WX_44890 [Streptomyces lasalocidi]